MSVLDYTTVLEDDNTYLGGVAYQGETLEEFLSSVGMPGETDIEKINKALRECGIKEIEL